MRPDTTADETPKWKDESSKSISSVQADTGTLIGMRELTNRDDCLWTQTSRPSGRRGESDRSIGLAEDSG